MQESLHIIEQSLSCLYPEFILIIGILLLIFLGLFKGINDAVFLIVSVLIYVASLTIIIQEHNTSAALFNGIIVKESFSTYLKILMDLAGLIVCLMCLNQGNQRIYKSEFYALLLTVVVGGHFLVMSNNLLLVFLTMEIVSIGSYVLAGYVKTKEASEGSLKYFLFGSVASAFMLYGFSLLYGVTGTLNFLSGEFAKGIIESSNPLILIAGFMALAGFLFKISAAPMHPWTPDVYQAAPIPVVAFLSVAPKIAGFGVLIKFTLAINTYGQSMYDWQTIISVVAILTLTVGNFSALAQKNVKRMMAYSSIAQSGFLLVGVAAFLPEGLQFMLFYAAIYLVMNFIVFIALQFFEHKHIVNAEDFSGKGKTLLWPSISILVGLVALTGLPPTAGFTGKLFVFSSLWESYHLSEKNILLWLFVFGLLNTVVSLFYYLKIPYYAFLKEGQSVENENFTLSQNLLSLILVLIVLGLFFAPGLLMGWINSVNFAL